MAFYFELFSPHVPWDNATAFSFNPHLFEWKLVSCSRSHYYYSIVVVEAKIGNSQPENWLQWRPKKEEKKRCHVVQRLNNKSESHRRPKVAGTKIIYQIAGCSKAETCHVSSHWVIFCPWKKSQSYFDLFQNLPQTQIDHVNKFERV